MSAWTDAIVQTAQAAGRVIEVLSRPGEPVEFLGVTVRTTDDGSTARASDFLGIELDPGLPLLEVWFRVGINEGPLLAIPLATDPADRDRHIASELQDLVIEEVGGDPRPPCPGHRHPLSPQVIGGRAVWICPADPTHHAEPV